MTYNDKNQIERVDFSKDGRDEGFSTFHYGPHGILEEKIFDTNQEIMETVFICIARMAPWKDIKFSIKTEKRLFAGSTGTIKAGYTAVLELSRKL